jgi:GNAT superfamily N-acetyltransferase
MPMDILVTATRLDRIWTWREMYRSEMHCQVVHDSIHERPGWTQEYGLSLGGAAVGYGSVAIGGPWKEKPTIYEFYVVPSQRQRMFDLFERFLEVSGVRELSVQSNDVLATVMLHTYAQHARSESILFHDKHVTSLALVGARYRQATASETPDDPPAERKWRGVIEVAGQAAASGGVLFHYNRPYGDIYMEVAEPFRRRGLGSYIVQELKRLCYENGFIPAARCSPANVASRRTLQKAGFVPCGHILGGRVD